MSQDSVETLLYDTDGTTLLAVLDSARAVQWQHELSRPGNASLEVPLTSSKTALITDRRIIKFAWKGAVRFGCRVVEEKVQAAADSSRWLRLENQPGLLSLLGDAVVLPEFGLSRTSAEERRFGWMSLDGAWRVAAEWIAPLGVRIDSDPTVRLNYPPEIRQMDAAAQWIANTPGPSTTVAEGTINLFRATFTLGAATSVGIYMSGDNSLTAYLDGEPIFEDDLQNPTSWREVRTYKAILASGTHQLASKVRNSAPTIGLNPVAFICVVASLNESGNPATILRRSDTTNWTVSDNVPEPGWRRAQVLKQLITEAQTRNVVGPDFLSLGFTDTTDSAAQAWSDRGEFVFPNVTMPLDEVAMQLAESQMDIDVNAATMTLHAYKRAGQDRRSTVRLWLADNLVSYETSKQVVRRTRAYGRLADGSWLDVPDSAGEAAYGRIETGAHFGSVNAPATGQGILEAILGETAAPHVSVTADSSALRGAVPYVDYQLGDTINVPGHRETGTALAARALAFTVDATGDVVRAWPELTQDRSI